MNYIEKARTELAQLLQAACDEAAAKGILPAGITLGGSAELTKDPKNGDMASNAAMASAKQLRMAPAKAAAALVENLRLEGSYFSSAEVAGPGFINLRFSDRWYSDVVNGVITEGENYGRTDSLQGQKIMVEFVSANPTGPMHLGNARGGVLGDALSEVLARAGAEVSREFYVNDAGNQVDKFARSIDARYKGTSDEDMPEDSYHGHDIIELAEAYRQAKGDVSSLSDSERLDDMARFGLEHNIPKMKADLEKYQVFYDTWFLESSLHSSGYVNDTIDALTARGYTYEKDGALWLKTSEIIGAKLLAAGKKPEQIEKLGLKDDVLRRANGFCTYFAADIAYHRNKLEVRGFDKAINIWGADHHGHVARLTAALDALGLDGEHRLEIVLMQLVKLMKDGEEVRMSKRTGNAIALADLLDEIPVDAARYFFNAKADTPVVFDIGLAVRQDSENPVYYVQYAHARICSMAANLSEEGIAAPAVADASVLTEDAERALIRSLASFPAELAAAANARAPYRVNNYVTDLASRFHKFYASCHIKGAEADVAANRLALSLAVKQTIANSLSIIGVSAPEKM